MRKIKDFLRSVWKSIRHPIKQIKKMNEEIKRLKREFAISDEVVRKIEQELSAKYSNRENNFVYSNSENKYMDYFTENTAKNYLTDESYLPPNTYNDISDKRGVSKSYNLAMGEISYILNGVTFPEKSLKFTNEYKTVNGKNINLVNVSINGTLSMRSDGTVLLDGQPLQMNQNIKNRLAEQIKELHGQNAKLSFNNGEFSILPRVQDKDSEKKKPNMREEMALPQDEQDRLAKLAQQSAKRIEKENQKKSSENIRTGELITEK